MVFSFNLPNGNYSANEIVDRLDIILCDDDENEIDFNGVPFSLSIGIVFDAKMEYTSPMRTNDEEFDMIEASV